MAVTKFPPAGRYTNISLSTEQISREDYKAYLGGGEECWGSRGLFQLIFMKSMGVLPQHRILDVGCGPGRASRHFIEFLEPGNYYGVDYNASFISAAIAMVEANGLAPRHPTLEVVNDFFMPESFPKFSFWLAFSVLNHCSQEQRSRFFASIPQNMLPGGKFYISHAGWTAKDPIEFPGLSLTRTIVDLGISLVDYGWQAGETVFPILELTKIAERTSI